MTFTCKLTIWPAPMTPTRFTSAAAYCRGEELKQRTWRRAPNDRVRRIAEDIVN